MTKLSDIKIIHLEREDLYFHVTTFKGSYFVAMEDADYRFLKKEAEAMERVRQYAIKCGIMRVEPSTAGLCEAMMEKS